MSATENEDGRSRAVPDEVHKIGAKLDSKRIKSVIAANAGNLVEWFDFYMYTFMALYFAPSFFPTGDTSSQLLAAAGIFAAGFLARPVGGWVFGWVGDVYGRKRAITFAVGTMFFGSFLIASLPTHASIGTAAPALLLVARLLQGLSVGGQYGAVATYVSEVAEPGRRGFYASWQYVTVLGAQLVSMLLLLVLQTVFSVEELREWAWRIPFFVGAAAAIGVLFIQRFIVESASKEAMSQKGAGTLGGLVGYRKSVILVVMFTMGGSLYFYTFTTYLQKLFVNSAGMDPKTVSAVMAAVLFIIMCLQPVFGSLSDKIGRRNCMLIFGTLAMVGAVPLLSAISSVTTVTSAFLLGLSATLIACFYSSISGVLKAELFPPQVRTLGVGLPYALANALFGGSAEYVALQMKSWGIESVFYWYVAAMAGVALIAALIMPDTRNRGFLDGSGNV